MQPEWLKDAFVITLNPDIVDNFAINLRQSFLKFENLDTEMFIPSLNDPFVCI